MAAHRLLADPDNDGWERSDFPIVCETCLGPNPYVRMQRIEFGGTCHISERPYTVFRWKPGNEARYKKTIVCQEVAKAKNVCQVCLLDLEYGLPVQVRDQALGKQDEGLPESTAGREYALQAMVESGELDKRAFDAAAPNNLLLKLQRKDPYYKRNEARVCSFYARGECKRGAECPYRHEMPTRGPLSEQNIRDRYYGVNDPVAEKMLDRVNNMGQRNEPPADRSITTLYVGNLTPAITEDDIRDVFYMHGELRSVRKVESRSCAFVTYTTREAAEKAMKALGTGCMIKGQQCRALWGKPQAPRADGGGPSGANAAPQGKSQYPSMDSQYLGSHGAEDQGGSKRREGGGPPDGGQAKRAKAAVPPPPGA